ncbi:nucleotidyltransferase domain-containing protein [Saccharopolyspora elongata]|uniref:Amino acid transporter n=1 Tax=Saccharopolyspora elongata TaxID=2530387 RepID=A0A4R4ZCB2_9PSEU|nr:amino acid transporter [Saccharopolyspora elongata]TDD55925.1 amino acid transporter [Saccharopolyspora elongata]
MAPELAPWDPAGPAEVQRLFSRQPAPWWVAGGYAVELAAGRRLREHGDIDVLLLRRDQLAVQQALAGWEWWAADPPGTLRPWRRDERLPAGVHDIWCRRSASSPWRIQVMLDESAGDEWGSRRARHLRRPIAEIGGRTADGIPFLAPEIQLFYKAANPRPKDEFDFAAVLPSLDAAQRRWLADAIATTCGAHPWLPALVPADAPRDPG